MPILEELYANKGITIAKSLVTSAIIIIVKAGGLAQTTHRYTTLIVISVKALCRWCQCV